MKISNAIFNYADRVGVVKSQLFLARVISLQKNIFKRFPSIKKSLFRCGTSGIHIDVFQITCIDNNANNRWKYIVTVVPANEADSDELSYNYAIFTYRDVLAF